MRKTRRRHHDSRAFVNFIKTTVRNDPDSQRGGLIHA